jgi:hypothetical protein
MADVLETAEEYMHTINETFTAADAENKSPQLVERIGAGDGDRTRDIRLGKPAFYR